MEKFIDFKMRKTFFCVFAFWLCFVANLSKAATAAYAQDTGTISNIYTGADGTISITLSNNFQKAVSTGQCNTNNGWAGNLTMSNPMKAALIAARANNLTVTVTTSGCEAGGTWLKIIDIYW